MSIGVDGQAGKQVLATVVQPGVMLPAQPSHLERVAIIIMVSIRLEASADLAFLPGRFTAFERALDRQVCPILFGILASPVSLPGVRLEIELAMLVSNASGSID